MAYSGIDKRDQMNAKVPSCEDRLWSLLQMFDQMTSCVDREEQMVWWRRICETHFSGVPPQKLPKIPTGPDSIDLLVYENKTLRAENERLKCGHDNHETSRTMQAYRKFEAAMRRYRFGLESAHEYWDEAERFVKELLTDLFPDGVPNEALRPEGKHDKDYAFGYDWSFIHEKEAHNG